MAAGTPRWVGSGRSGAAARAVSFEDRALRTGPLDLVEAGDGSDHQRAVPHLRRLLATRGGGDDGAEERDLLAVGAGHGDDGGADVLADLVDALLVGGA